MGGAVSSGRDNNELVDNLMSGKYIRSPHVERVFRALDRGDYMTPEARDQAYKDIAWRSGPLHLSSPCIYSEVMEGLELKPGLSFLNIGSGTGYLSTMVGLILGSSGINHGVELHPGVVEYAVMKVGQFFDNSAILDDFDFCQPQYYTGNGLCLAPLASGYDRVYVGAGCPEEYQKYFEKLLKVGGILVMPLNDTLLQIRRTSETKWESRSLLNVTFETLRLPTREDASAVVKLDELTPVPLQYLARSVIRCAMHKGVHRRNPELREAPRPPPPATCPRRICIPIEPGGAVEGLNVFHDLDSENGGTEMNALLSLVISMGHNRVAGALRFDRVESDGDSSESDDEDDDQPEQSGDEENQQPDDTTEDPPNDPSDSSQQDSDSDDRRSPRPRRRRPDPKSKSDKSRRQRRPRNDGPDDPKSNVPLLAYKGLTDEPSTSSKDTQTSVGDLTDSSDLKSESEDDNPLRSKNLIKSRIPPGVLSEADIDLPSKAAQTASTSHIEMDWEETKADTLEASNNDSDTKNKAKRQKLLGLTDEPSTSRKDTQTSIGDLTDTSDLKSESEDESPHCSKDLNKPRIPPGMPSEVEIDLPSKESQTASTSHIEMYWEETKADNLEVSDDDSETKNKPKRQKLDSGIEENSPSSSSAGKSKSESDGNRSGSPTPDSDDDSVTGMMRRHAEMRRRRIARGGNARRARLSLLMKQAVKELPLPHELKKFVNLGRCYKI